jgi:hypothetical protein
MSIIISLVDHDDVLSRSILVRTGGEYAHAEAITPQGTIIGAFALGGVQERPIDYDGGKFLRKLFLLLPTDDATSAAFHHYLRACLGEPYAFRDIAGFVSPFDLHEAHRVFCSALMVDALRGSSYFPHPLPIPAHCVYPVLLQQMLLVRPDVRPVLRTDPEFVSHISPSGTITGSG